MPILSMTGFGVAERDWTERGVRVHVELRSVNARYLELKLRQPLRTFTTDGPGLVLLCSDGLWNYYPEPEALSAAAMDDTPLAAARRMVRMANEAGGHDNITVVLIPFGQGDRDDATVVFPKERSD
jgi:serine/threonine protein phosphatase PrpC